MHNNSFTYDNHFFYDFHTRKSNKQQFNSPEVPIWQIVLCYFSDMEDLLHFLSISILK